MKETLGGIMIKKLVLIIFLVGFSRVFPAFEFDILGQLVASTSFPITVLKTVKVNGSTEAEFGASLQIGYQFPMTNSLKGVSVFCDIKVEQSIIGLTLPGNTKDTRKNSGLNLGVGLTSKLIFGSINSLVPRDTILGFGLGAKVLAFAPNIMFSSNIPFITPYVDLFVEQRFFVSRKLALVCGIIVGFDWMIFQQADMGIFGGTYISGYPSLNIGLSIGLHFGH